jgi:hypothetical protein
VDSPGNWSAKIRTTMTGRVSDGGSVFDIPEPSMTYERSFQPLR